MKMLSMICHLTWLIGNRIWGKRKSYWFFPHIEIGTTDDGSVWLYKSDFNTMTPIIKLK